MKAINADRGGDYPQADDPDHRIIMAKRGGFEIKASFPPMLRNRHVIVRITRHGALLFKAEFFAGWDKHDNKIKVFSISDPEWFAEFCKIASKN
jgi:hypothetical protein